MSNIGTDVLRRNWEYKLKQQTETSQVWSSGEYQEDLYIGQHREQVDKEKNKTQPTKENE